jgi:KDO2-lipid IV(A) lauroyltransferase
VWYTPDQDFGLKQGVMAPFFGVPAATLTAQRRLVKLDQSAVMAVHFYRQDDRRPHYHMTLTPVLEHYPSADEVADATRINELLESLIRIAPTQYMWFHRRFKTRPNGMEKVY